MCRKRVGMHEINRMWRRFGGLYHLFARYKIMGKKQVFKQMRMKTSTFKYIFIKKEETSIRDFEQHQLILSVPVSLKIVGNKCFKHSCLLVYCTGTACREAQTCFLSVRPRLKQWWRIFTSHHCYSCQAYLTSAGNQLSMCPYGQKPFYRLGQPKRAITHVDTTPESPCYVLLMYMCVCMCICMYV